MKRFGDTIRARTGVPAQKTVVIRTRGLLLRRPPTTETCRIDKLRIVSLFASAGFAYGQGYREDGPDTGCLKFTIDSLQEQPSCHASEFGGGLTDGGNRRSDQGKEGDIVKAYERNIFANFNLQLLECFDHPDS